MLPVSGWTNLTLTSVSDRTGLLQHTNRNGSVGLGSNYGREEGHTSSYDTGSASMWIMPTREHCDLEVAFGASPAGEQTLSFGMMDGPSEQHHGYARGVWLPIARSTAAEGGGHEQRVSSVSGLRADEWNHIVIVVRMNQASLYVNGTLARASMPQPISWFESTRSSNDVSCSRSGVGGGGVASFETQAGRQMAGPGEAQSESRGCGFVHNVQVYDHVVSPKLIAQQLIEGADVNAMRGELRESHGDDVQWNDGAAMTRQFPHRRLRQLSLPTGDLGVELGYRRRLESDDVTPTSQPTTYFSYTTKPYLEVIASLAVLSGGLLLMAFLVRYHRLRRIDSSL